jgi:hypothetical protein
MQIVDLKQMTAILWGPGHIKGRPCMGGIGQGKETSKNAMFLFLSFMFFLLQNWRTGGGKGYGREGLHQ